MRNLITLRTNQRLNAIPVSMGINKVLSISPYSVYYVNNKIHATNDLIYSNVKEKGKELNKNL